METLLILAAWYVPGAVAAHWMIHRGHSALAWIYIAWIGGALALPIALLWHRMQPAFEEADRNERILA